MDGQDSLGGCATLSPVLQSADAVRKTFVLPLYLSRSHRISHMNTPNPLHATAAVRSGLTQLRAGLGKLLGVSRAGARHFIPATATERAVLLRGRLALSYRLTNADDILVFAKRHKYLLPLLDVIPGKILAAMAAEPETVHGIDLEYFPDYGDGDDHLTVVVNTNIDNHVRMFEIDDALFAKVLEPFYAQAKGKILIRVEFE